MGHNNHYLELGRYINMKKQKVVYQGKKIKFKKRAKNRLEKLSLDFSLIGKI